MPDPNRVSWLCWDGKHSRCSGWLVVTGTYRGGMSVACECHHCKHPDVAPYRHLYEEIQKGMRWNSSTITRW